MAQVYEFDGVRPVVAESAFIHPSAELIGDVIIGPGCYVGPTACLRGDFGRIIIEAGANIQDTCVLHSFADKEVRVEIHGHVGHGAILHGCVVGRNALVGMNAVIMDGAVLGENSFVAAMAFVKSGFEVPPQTLVAGAPARIVRKLTEQEISWKAGGTALYQELARRCNDSLVRVEPLREAEPDRGRRRAWPDHATLTLRESRGG